MHFILKLFQNICCKLRCFMYTGNIERDRTNERIMKISSTILEKKVDKR